PVIYTLPLHDALPIFLLRLRAGPAAGQESRHHLVHERLVELGAEGAVRDLDRAGSRKLELHHAAPLFFALTAGRTTTRAPRWPGTAPLTRIRLRSASTRTTSRFCTVQRTLPRCPAMRLDRKSVV